MIGAGSLQPDVWNVLPRKLSTPPTRSALAPSLPLRLGAMRRSLPWTLGGLLEGGMLSEL